MHWNLRPLTPAPRAPCPTPRAFPQALLARADGLVPGGGEVVDAALLALCPNCKVVSANAVGYVHTCHPNLERLDHRHEPASRSDVQSDGHWVNAGNY